MVNASELDPLISKLPDDFVTTLTMFSTKCKITRQKVQIGNTKKKLFAMLIMFRDSMATQHEGIFSIADAEIF